MHGRKLAAEQVLTVQCIIKKGLPVSPDWPSISGYTAAFMRGKNSKFTKPRKASMRHGDQGRRVTGTSRLAGSAESLTTPPWPGLNEVPSTSSSCRSSALLPGHQQKSDMSSLDWQG